MFLIFDTETTGLPKNFNAPLSDSENWPRMVQISWQLHDKEGKLVENKDYIIKPEAYDIPFNATKIHGITTKIAQEKGSDLKEVLEEFQEVLAKTKVAVGHNIAFDYNIVGAELFRKNLPNPLQEISSADTMLLGTDYCRLPGGRAGKYKSPKLGELFEKLYGKSFDEAHNAAADVNATAQVFFEMLRLGIIPKEKLLFSEEELLNFQQVNAFPIQAFDIAIRRQVENFRKKGEKKEEVSISTIDIGDYFHFHNHSIYSTLSSTTSIKDLVDNALKNNFPAVGMVDIGNMMGAFKFISAVEKANANFNSEYKSYVKEKQKAKKNGEEFSNRVPEKPDREDLIPILGCEFYISENPEQKQFTKDNLERRTQVVLLAKNAEGYKNLIKLSSLGYVNGFYAGVPRISKKQISEYKQDLIALTSGLLGDIPDAILNFGEKKGEELLQWWKAEFGSDFYIQIQNHGLQEEEHLNKVLLDFAQKYEIKILAQNETFYTHRTDARIQDIVTCIKDGEKLATPIGKGYGKRRGLTTDQFYLQNREELKQVFSHYTEGFSAYSELLSKFEPYTLKREVLLPKFNIPNEFIEKKDETDGGKRGEMAYLTHLTYVGAKKKYGEITDEIRQRIDFEIEIIEKTGYPGYFLIVQDFCNEAKKRGISVGPGRGSAAGSVVAYCIGITNVDPIKYDLLFERFLNPERVSMPDIDIDFDDEGRDEIIKWVIDKYGQNQVAQIITYSILGGKSAIKDAGRVLDVSIPETNNIAKLIPNNPPGLNIAKVVKSELEKFRPEDQHLVKELKEILKNPKDQRYPVLDSAYKIEGCIRNTGIHACGVIITPEDISNLIPVSIAAKDADILVSQFDNSVVESAGLLKMDFLGLRTLTIIKDAIKLIEQKHNIAIDPDEIPLDDAKTYQLFKEGRTVGIFQYESPGMQKYLRDLKPDKFDDLIAMNALYRPGPIKYIPNFINRKHGLEKIEYDLPETEEYLQETYGITVYQEQVMLLSQKLANFTKGQADTLRKVMGKKQRDMLDEMFPLFIEGGKANNLEVSKLEKIWKDWESFASYAFNKSHSTCYALIAYHTAYLKANFPAEYMASVMSNNINNTKQITMFMEDCKNIGVDVLGPDVNESQYEFAVNEKGQIRFGLGAIKGMGEGASESISKEREQGRFKDIFNFFERISNLQINKRIVEALVMAGAFDELDTYHRAQYFDIDNSGKTTVEKLLRYGQSFQENKNMVETSLFADIADEIKIETPKIMPLAEWQNMIKLNKEKEIIGFYLSSHPLDEFKLQYAFMKGDFLKKNVLEEEMLTEIDPNPVDVISTIIEVDEFIEDEMREANEDLVEEATPKINPKGAFNFLNLDELDSFKEIVFNTQQPELFGKMDWKERRNQNERGKEYVVAGLVSEYVIRDGKISGEKVAFVTLEDYSGSYSFRLGDKDYMRLRDKIDTQRFLIFKVRFSQGKDGRVFVNVSDIVELKEAFEKYAKILSVVLPVNDFREEDLEFFKKIFSAYKGDGNVHFYLKNSIKNEVLEIKSLHQKVNIDTKILEEIKRYGKYDIFLN